MARQLMQMAKSGLNGNTQCLQNEAQVILCSVPHSTWKENHLSSKWAFEFYIKIND